MVCIRHQKVPEWDHPAMSLPINDVMDRVQIDYVFGLPLTQDGYKGIAVFIEPLTKFLFLMAIKSKTGEESARCYFKFVSIFGPSKQLLSDQGKEFLNETVDNIRAMQIKNMYEVEIPKAKQNIEKSQKIQRRTQDKEKNIVLESLEPNSKVFFNSLDDSGIEGSFEYCTIDKNSPRFSMSRNCARSLEEVQSMGYTNYFVLGMSKYSVDGYGYKCTRKEVKITTFKSFFGARSMNRDTSDEVISKEECLAMVI
ncbi:KRAB-A domain-containing 2-like [Brachionus plicatilis]|uniref:KRAB-A domain-containing 2-like n=1 Tax=Brachionus plicatilis TaxID=10195 RepID=A0A3M7QX26_BRAPC|nr:KRAB-A domain-containing 2-like [Brachionus plicatilis]